jgi:ADP-ribose pyrophosphatase YjhB (NUDIX family)
VTCEACRTQHWQNAKPCANAIVADGDKVLLVRRAHTPWRGAWCAPGGFCEAREHPIAAVEREVFEEAGVRVEVTGFIGIWIDDYADEPNPDNETISVAYYHARPTGGPAGVVDAAEVAELGWFAWRELPDALAPPGTLEAVLAGWRADVAAGRTISPLPDYPHRGADKLE